MSSLIIEDSVSCTKFRFHHTLALIIYNAKETTHYSLLLNKESVSISDICGFILGAFLFGYYVAV